MRLDDLLAFEVARVVLEVESPFLIGVEGGDGFHDATFTTDANGLPAIPGESLAGIIRHALAGRGGPDLERRCNKAFGFQDEDSGQASAVELSWGHVHNSKDEPVPFRGAKTDDPVLAFLAAGTIRDHVRLDMNGVADGAGKFDVLLVPAGARFTFELRVLKRAGIDVSELLAILARPEVTLGRAGRRGLGRFKVVRASRREFDLRRAADLEAWERFPVDVSQPIGGVLVPIDLSKVRIGSAAGRWTAAKLELVPRGTWLTAGTIDPGLDLHARKDRSDGRKGGAKAPERFPMAERRVVWTQDVGAVSERPDWLLPGSSLKGLLRHRVAFHARAAAGAFAPTDGRSLTPEASRPPDAETFWFGAARDAADAEPGRVRIGDCRLQMAASGPNADLVELDHVSLDRFTQGPIDGRLFDEAVLGSKLRLAVELIVDATEADPPSKAALASALADLVAGRLWVGAAGSRGHGAMTGKITWVGSDPLGHGGRS